MRRARFIAAVTLTLYLVGPVYAAGEETKLQQARELVRSGKPAQAVPIYKQLLEASPQDPSLVMNLAIAYFQAGEYEQSAEQCRAALTLRPGWGSPLLFLGASHVRLGEPGVAVEFLEKAAVAQPEERNTRLMLGEALLQTDRLAEAIPHLEKAAQLLPDSPRVWYGLSRCYASLAQQRLAGMESSARGSAYWHALAGDDLLRLGRFGRALSHYREALALQPEMRGLHRSIASLYERAGRRDWAAVESQKASAANQSGCESNDAACLFQAARFRDVLGALRSSEPLASLYWEAKAYRALAEQSAGKLEQLPVSPQFHELAARSLAERALFREAAKRWHEALVLDPDSAILKEGLAISLRNSRDHRGALAVLAELANEQPVRPRLAYLYGDSLVETGRPAEAVRLLASAVKADPTLLVAQASLGRAYALSGEARKAIPHLQAALPTDEDGSIHYQLAMAYRDAGEPELSRQTLVSYERIRSEAAARLRELDAEIPITGP